MTHRLIARIEKMKIRIWLFPALVWAVLAGCSSSPSSSLSPAGAGAAQHGSASLLTDAGAVDSGADGGPGSAGTWTLVSMPILALMAEEFAPVHPERTTRILAVTTLSGCERPAMPVITWTEHAVYLEMRAWRSSGVSCAAETRPYPRMVSLRLPTPGTWTIAPGPPGAPGAAPLTIEVALPPARSCAPDMGISCEMDCDCPSGSACLSGLGLSGPFTACGTPCEFDRDCDGAGMCLSIADGLSSICEQSLPECSNNYPCSDGYACTNGVCEIDVHAGLAARRACMSDSDCDPPLHCVAPANGGISRCEVLCSSASPAWCMSMHICGDAQDDAANLAEESSVCVWVGE